MIGSAKHWPQSNKLQTEEAQVSLFCLEVLQHRKSSCRYFQGAHSSYQPHLSELYPRASLAKDNWGLRPCPSQLVWYLRNVEKLLKKMNITCVMGPSLTISEKGRCYEGLLCRPLFGPKLVSRHQCLTYQSSQ